MFVSNRTLLRDPRRFAQRCRAAAEDRGWEPWFAPDPVADSPALTRLAIVPLGTANLAARALGVPARADRAIDAGFDGRDRRIDLGHLTCADEAGKGPAAGTGTEEGGTVFAAMAGIGLDAAVVGAARQQVKRRLGWMAYAAAGVTQLRWPACDFSVQLDDEEPLRRRARCVVVGNAGLLPGGFTLLPGAQLDDGLLDVGILAPSGAWGWMRVAGRVLAHGGRQDRELERFQAGRVQVSVEVDLPRQVDGEIVAPGRTLSVSVCPSALTVRRPR